MRYLLIIISLTIWLFSAEHPPQTSNTKEYCPLSGLEILPNIKTSFIVELKDKNTLQYVSLSALAVDYDNIAEKIDKIYTIDYKKNNKFFAIDGYFVKSSNLKDPLGADFVICFEDEQDAKEYASKNKTNILLFNDIFNEIYKKKQQIWDSFGVVKEKKEYKTGRAIFSKTCKMDIDLSSYKNIADLKGDLKYKQFCKKLDEDRLQKTALYLWDVKRIEDSSGAQKPIDAIEVDKKHKCPVCGMFVYKYPKWVALIETLSGEQFYFDGVKDMMKFYFEPSKWGYEKKLDIKSMKVTNYYTQKALDARYAIYVIGSDVFGPMGHEFIPFHSENEAKTFKFDHKGNKILKFDEITKEQTYKLDE